MWRAVMAAFFMVFICTERYVLMAGLSSNKERV